MDLDLQIAEIRRAGDAAASLYLVIEQKVQQTEPEEEAWPLWQLKLDLNSLCIALSLVTKVGRAWEPTAEIDARFLDSFVQLVRDMDASLFCDCIRYTGGRVELVRARRASRRLEKKVRAWLDEWIRDPWVLSVLRRKRS